MKINALESCDVFSGKPQLQPVIVPDGKWAVRVFEIIEHEEGDKAHLDYVLIGLDRDVGEKHLLRAYPRIVHDHTDKKGRAFVTESLRVADKPFGVVQSYGTSSGMAGVDYENAIKFNIAGQVQGDRMVNRMNIVTPHFLRGPKGWRWIRFDNLASFLHLTLEQLWNALFFEDADGEQEFLWGAPDAQSPEVAGPCWLHHDESDFSLLRMRSRVWVPAGLAMVIIQMSHLMDLKKFYPDDNIWYFKGDYL